jgi:L-amino acid N-acyltransferase YncA
LDTKRSAGACGRHKPATSSPYVDFIPEFAGNFFMQFRNAIFNDLPAIVAIYNSTIPGRMVTADTSPVTVADKETWFYEHDAARRPLWIVEEDAKLIGWVSFGDFYGRPAYDGTAEVSIYLHAQARGKGYGKKILDECIGKAPSLNIHTLLGFIFSHNRPSIQLFLHAGFEEWGHLKDIAVMEENVYSLKIFGRRVTGFE